MIPPKYWSPTKKLMVLGAMAGGKLVEDTATGNPLTFITDKAKPLKSLLIPFTPQQEGTGDPSPQNIRSILPWNGLTVFGGGKNLFDESEYQHIYTDPDYIWEVVPYRCKYIQLSPNTNYTISSRAGTTSDEIVLINNRQQPNVMPFFDLRNASQTITFKTDETGRLYIGSVNGDDASTYNRIKECKIQIEVGSAESAYEPYRPITETDIPFPSPVYGGTLDAVTGVLTVEYAIVDASDLTWNNTNQSAIGVFRANLPTARNLDDKFNVYSDKYKNGDASSSIAYMQDNTIKGYNGEQYQDYVYIRDGRYTDVADFTQELDCEICYQLATPQEIQLTPQQITALVGDNTIWSDADGQMTAVYLKKG